MSGLALVNAREKDYPTETRFAVKALDLIFIHSDGDTVTAFLATTNGADVQRTLENISPVNRAVLVEYARLIIEADVASNSGRPA